jgi:hypothetical protein
MFSVGALLDKYFRESGILYIPQGPPLMVFCTQESHLICVESAEEDPDWQEFHGLQGPPPTWLCT